MGNKDSGFLKIYRSFFDHFLWSKDREFSKAEAWIDLLRTARYDEGTNDKMVNGNVVEWNRGELLASVRFLKNRWNWNSTGKVTRFLELLEKQNMIERKTEQGVTVVSICNYSTYNPLQNDNRTGIEHKQNRDRTETEQRQGQNSKKVKKDKKERYVYGTPEKWDEDQPIDHQSFVEAFNELYGRQLRVTDKKRKNIRNRLRTYTGLEIKQAWGNRKRSVFLNGKGKKYMGDWAAAMRNDEKIDNYLNLPDEEMISTNGLDNNKMRKYAKNR